MTYGIAGQTGEAVAPVIDINEQLIGIVGVRETIGVFWPRPSTPCGG